MKEDLMDVARLYAMAEVLPKLGFGDWAPSVKRCADRLRDVVKPSADTVSAHVPIEKVEALRVAAMNAVQTSQLNKKTEEALYDAAEAVAPYTAAKG